MEKKTNTPALRFRGFNGPWEKKKIHDIAEIVGGGTPSTLEPNYWGGDIDWYTPAEMEGMRYAEGSERKLTTAGLKNSGAKLLPADRTILFTSRAGIGKMAVLKKTAATNQGFQSLVLGAHNNPYFFYSMGTIITKMAEAVASGSTFLEISGKKLGELAITIPDVEEQSKVADLFVSFDDLLEAQEQKIKKLEQFRQAMLTKLFPAEGASEPALRFRGFSGPWVKRQLQDCTNRFDNLRVPVTASERIAGRTPYYGANGIQDYVQGYTHIGEFILIAEDGANDLKNYPVQYVNGEIWVNNHAHVLQGIANISDTKFLGYVISQLDMRPYLVGGGRAKLNANTMMEIVITIPADISEQKKIGNFFQNLDNLLSLQKEKLEKLRLLKAALLDKLFV